MSTMTTGRSISRSSMAATGVNVVREVVICEDHLYKLRSMTGLRTFSLNYKPWRRKYFILKKKKDDTLMLEYFDRQPMSKRKPKMQLSLFPKYRVEKITNSKNRAYVFEITTPEKRLCLSANEQRTMDMFVFFLQIQHKLVPQITDDYVVVQPENSETMRRIGAKGCPCILHISPWGVTLALQSSRRVLAQWPLKSIRCYESSCQGQFSLEAGRIAPMGDGLYIFNTQPGQDDQLYDLLDHHVVNALQKIRPGQQRSHHLEEYVVEAKRLQALTQLSICTQHQEEIPRILQENWNLILPSLESNRRTSSSSSVPPRPEFLPNLTNGDAPPPLPTRSTTGLTEISPSSSEAFVPDFRSLRLHPSRSQPALQRRPIDESNQSVPEFSSPAKRPGYLNPSVTRQRLASQSESLPSPVEGDRFSCVFESEVDSNLQYLTACQTSGNSTEGDPDQMSNDSKLRNRLKSRSCEDLNHYLKMSRLDAPAQLTPSSPVESEKENKENPVEIPPIPFPRLQNLRNSLYCDSSNLTSYRMSTVYYGNVGKKSNGVYETPTPGVSELKQIFDNGGSKKMRKSVSNPNFFNISSKDNSMGQTVFSPEPNNLNSNNKHKFTYRSWKNLFSDRRRKSNHETHNGASRSSTGDDASPLTDRPISKSRSSSFSRRPSQGQASSTQITDTYGTTGMKGVRMTPKTRSYRRLKSDSSVLAKSQIKDNKPPIASVESLC